MDYTPFEKPTKDFMCSDLGAKMLAPDDFFVGYRARKNRSGNVVFLEPVIERKPIGLKQYAHANQLARPFDYHRPEGWTAGTYTGPGALPLYLAWEYICRCEEFDLKKSGRIHHDGLAQVGPGSGTFSHHQKHRMLMILSDHYARDNKPHDRTAIMQEWKDAVAVADREFMKRLQDKRHRRCTLDDRPLREMLSERNLYAGYLSKKLAERVEKQIWLDYSEEIKIKTEVVNVAGFEVPITTTETIS